MSYPLAPFRADHVGSLLRPAALERARKAHLEEGVMPAEELSSIEDAAIREAVAMQVERGLPVVTDGAFRAAPGGRDFLAALEGFDTVAEAEGPPAVGAGPSPPRLVFRDRIGFPADHPMPGQFRFLAAIAPVQPKAVIPAPSAAILCPAGGDGAVTDHVRRDPDGLLDDIARTWRAAVAAFHAAGCRYLQFDDDGFARLCDPLQREAIRREGLDPDLLIGRLAGILEEAIRDRPEDMRIGLHVGGTPGGAGAAAGAWERVADAIFNATSVDIYLLALGEARTGGLELLRFLPAGSKRVMAGFVSSGPGARGTVDGLRRRFDAVGRVADLDQFGLAPDRGFARDAAGGAASFDDQRRALDLVVETAERIWGGVAR
jgi:5-methyltetrahydropteroyltriglutamate--homocysteine methyltransferase